MHNLSSFLDLGDEALKSKNYPEALEFYDQALKVDSQFANNDQALPLLVYSSARCLSLASLLDKTTKTTEYNRVLTRYIEDAFSSEEKVKEVVDLSLSNVLLVLPNIAGSSAEKIIKDIQKMLSNKAENAAEENSDAIYDIWSAIDSGNPQEILRFISQVNKKYIIDGRSIYPIHIATDLGNADITELLINKGANVNAVTTSRDTPLHFAARYEDESLVRLLLARGANIYRINEFKDRPIDCALVRGRVEVFKTLLEREEDQSVSKLSTFLFKAKKGGEIALFLESRIEEEKEKEKAFRAERKKTEKEAKLKAENDKKLEEEAKAQKAAQEARLKAEAEAKILEETTKTKGKKYKVNLEKREAAAAERKKLEEKEKAKLELKAKLEAEAKEKADQIAQMEQEKASKELEEKLKKEESIEAAQEQARIEASEKRLAAEAKKTSQTQVEEKAKLASDEINSRAEEKSNDEEGSIHSLFGGLSMKESPRSRELSPAAALDSDTPTASTDAESVSSIGTASSRFTTRSYVFKTEEGLHSWEVPTAVAKEIYNAGHRVGMGSVYKRIEDQKQLHNQKLAQSYEQNHYVAQDSQPVLVTAVVPIPVPVHVSHPVFYPVYVQAQPSVEPFQTTSVEHRQVVYIHYTNHTHPIGEADAECMMCIMGGAFVPDPLE